MVRTWIQVRRLRPTGLHTFFENPGISAFQLPMLKPL